MYVSPGGRGGIEAEFGKVEVERKFTEDGVESCATRLLCHKAAGAHGIMNKFMKFVERG